MCEMEGGFEEVGTSVCRIGAGGEVDLYVAQSRDDKAIELSSN